jgi:histidinol-phosphate aminotransferase
VLTVIDQAYREYVLDPAYPDAVEEYFKQGRNVLVLRSFSKIYGLAGLRVGYAFAPEPVLTGIAKKRRAFDVTSLALEAALERLRDVNAARRPELAEILERHGLAVVGPAVGNFVYAEVGGDSRGLFERLLAQGVIVRPLHGFGAPGAVRVTVGTPEEHAFLDTALSAVEESAKTR